MTLELPLWTLIPGVAVASALLQAFCIISKSKPYIFSSFEAWLLFIFIFGVMVLGINYIGDKFFK